jgi:hypothetical protein
MIYCYYIAACHVTLRDYVKSDRFPVVCVIKTQVVLASLLICLVGRLMNYDSDARLNMIQQEQTWDPALNLNMVLGNKCNFDIFVIKSSHVARVAS